MGVETILKIVATWAVLLIPLITGLTEVIKRQIPDEKLKDRLTALIAITISVCLSLLLIESSVIGLVAGLMIGLSSVGLWNAVTNPFKKEGG